MVAWSTTRSSRWLISSRWEMVELHRAHDGADVGHGQVEHGVFELVHLIGGLGGIEHLEEGDAIDLDHGVVAGDHLLARHFEHALHHVHLRADAVDEGDDQREPWRQGADVTAEALDRIVVALRHDPDPLEDGDDHQCQKYQDEDAQTLKHWLFPSRGPLVARENNRNWISFPS
jgi:hypothetical protein